MSGGTTYSLEVPAAPESVDRVHGLIDQIWAECQLGEHARIRFETALIEIVGNIVQHSAPPAGRDVVTISLGIDVEADGTTAHVSDDAAEAELDADGSAMPGWEAESGRGFALARSLTDVLRYRRRDGLNEWQLSCRS